MTQESYEVTEFQKATDNERLEEPRAERRLRLAKQVMMVMAVSLANIALGAVLTWPSPAVSSLEKDNSTLVGTEIVLNAAEKDMTGDGPPPPPLGPIDEMIEDILGPDNETIMGETVEDLMDVLRADITDVRPATEGATADPVVSVTGHESADAPTVLYVDASAEEVLPPSEDPTTAQMAALKAVESAAQAHNAAAQAVASAVRIQEAAARAQESAARAKEQAAKEKIEVMRLKAKHYKFKLEHN